MKILLLLHYGLALAMGIMLLFNISDGSWFDLLRQACFALMFLFYGLYLQFRRNAFQYTAWVFSAVFIGVILYRLAKMLLQ